MTNDVIAGVGEQEPAIQGVESPVIEAEAKLPLFSQEGTFIASVTSEEAQALMKAGVAHLFRSRSGKDRRVQFTHSKEVIVESYLKGSIITDASRTVRRQFLTSPYWTFQHIGQDLAEKQAIKIEELKEDGVLGQ